MATKTLYFKACLRVGDANAKLSTLQEYKTSHKKSKEVAFLNSKYVCQIETSHYDMTINISYSNMNTQSWTKPSTKI